MKTRFCSRLAAASLFVLSGVVHATPLGFDDDPLGSRLGAALGYAFWDSFSAAAFGYTSPDAGSGSGVFAGALQSTMAGGVATGGGDRLYAMGNAFDLTINGGTGTGATAIVMQLKFTSPSVGMPEDFFDVSLAGVGVPSSGSLFGTSTEDAGTFNIMTYAWTDLAFTPGSQVKVTISSAADHVSLDGISMDVASVPEPSVVFLLGAAVLFVVVARGRWRRVIATAR
jgi:hypothetical protein